MPQSRRASFPTFNTIANSPTNQNNNAEKREAKSHATNNLRLFAGLILAIAAILISLQPPSTGSFGSRACVNQIYSVHTNPLEACKDSITCVRNLLLEGWDRLIEWVRYGLVLPTRTAILRFPTRDSSQSTPLVRLASQLAYTFAKTVNWRNLGARVREYLYARPRNHSAQNSSLPVLAMIWDILLLFSVAW